jgi:hypothetical protein
MGPGWPDAGGEPEHIFTTLTPELLKSAADRTLRYRRATVGRYEAVLVIQFHWAEMGATAVQQKSF